MHPPRRSSPFDFGLLALIVGPSGAGKDTLIAGARIKLADDPRFAFPARVVTRPRDGGAEQHIPLSVVDFGAAEKSGELALSWHSHGHAYGIPSHALDGLARGKIVIVNVSRTIIGLAEALGTRVAVLNVTASPAVLAMRLSARGRESLEDAQRRLDRDVPIVTRGAPAITIINEGLPAAGIDHFTSVLLDLAEGLAAETGQ